MKKFEAVSGDQSLFDLVGASDESVYIFKFPNRLKALSKKSIDGELIAERKPIEKYVPKVGDEFKVDNLSSELKCVFIDKFGIVYGEIGGVLLDLPIYKHEFTKIDRRPNPVNMVEEKWFPKTGESFRVGGILYREAKYHNEGKIIGGYHEALGYKTQVYHPIETKFERP